MKQLTSLLLALIMVLGVLTVPVMAETAPLVGRYGDADGDGASNASDALYVLKTAVGKIETDYSLMCYLDVNYDLKLDASDALDILKFAVGKITSFSAANDYAGTVSLGANHVYLQQGGTAVVGILFDTADTDYEVKVTYYGEEVLDVTWDDDWMLESGNFITIHISSLISVAAEQVIPMQVYYTAHPSVYQMLYIHLMPEQSQPYDYPAFPGMADFGDFVHTAPEWVDTEQIDDTLSVSMVYDSATILANGNSGSCYDDYLAYLDEELEYVSCTMQDDGYYENVFKGEKYTLITSLMDDEDGTQKIFVYVEGNLEDL